MAHCCVQIDIELSNERVDRYQQRSLSLPMFHLLSLVLDIDTYKYLSFIGLRAFRLADTALQVRHISLFKAPVHATVQSELASSLSWSGQLICAESRINLVRPSRLRVQPT